MSHTISDSNSTGLSEKPLVGLCNRMSVEEIARRLNIGRQTVYVLLERGVLPGIRLGQRWLITRHAYLEWERTCGVCNRSASATGLQANTEVRS